MNIREWLKKTLPASFYNRLRSIKAVPARAIQGVMERCGLVAARASDYYSPLPSRRQLKLSMDRWSRPSSMRGIEYDLTAMKVTFSNLIAAYYREFEALGSFENASKAGFGPGYTRLDAIVLYAMIRMRKPAQYLEVGSGLSTYYANAAGQLNAREGRPMQITCIEPYPFDALLKMPGISVKKMPVQDASLDLFTALGRNDVLFIDSSHIVRLDGDVPFLFLEVLPILHPGLLIHVHDIPFPYHGPYPPDYWIYKQTWPVWWNESMLLHALLCGNKQFSITLSAPLIRYDDEAFLSDLVPGYKTIKEEPNTFSSIWLEKMG
jgi:predicted O-methyltransferase YrrM